MFILNCKGSLLVIDQPIVMGIINATPDSFYAGSRFSNPDQILRQAEKMINEGADILDIGGQTTQPGSAPLPEEQELRRVVEGVEAIHKRFPEVFISIDTYYSTVARICVHAGASIVNDISAGAMDEKMIPTVANLKVPFVLMHMKGTPQTMQKEAHYDNLLVEVFDFLVQKKEECRRAGILDVILDPGFGFAKTVDQNFELLRNLSLFTRPGAPVLAGVSRKSSIYKTLGISAAEALNGTTVLNTIALEQGASILRVHDVKQAREAVKLFGAVSGRW